MWVERCCCPVCMHESPDNRLISFFLFLAYSHPMPWTKSACRTRSGWWTSSPTQWPGHRGWSGLVPYSGFSPGRPCSPGTSGSNHSSHGGTRWWARSCHLPRGRRPGGPTRQVAVLLPGRGFLSGRFSFFVSLIAPAWKMPPRRSLCYHRTSEGFPGKSQRASPQRAGMASKTNHVLQPINSNAVTTLHLCLIYKAHI